MHVRLAATFAVGALLAPVSWSTEITRDYTFSGSLTSVVIDAVTYTACPSLARPVAKPGPARLPAGSAYLIPGEVVTEIRVTGTETLVGDGYLVEPAGMRFAISRGHGRRTSRSPTKLSTDRLTRFPPRAMPAWVRTSSAGTTSWSCAWSRASTSRRQAPCTTTPHCT